MGREKDAWAKLIGKFVEVWTSTHESGSGIVEDVFEEPGRNGSINKYISIRMGGKLTILNRSVVLIINEKERKGKNGKDDSEAAA